MAQEHEIKMTAIRSNVETQDGLPRVGMWASVAASLMLAACAQSGGAGPGGLALSQADTAKTAAAEAEGPGDPLEKATQYWGKEYAKNPSDLTKALSYAKNLKAMGEKQRALAVLQQASSVHGQNRELASEYGRLALELGQVKVASQVLAAADDPTKPDWKVISARGAVLAKQEKYAEAIPLFQRALALSNDQPSVLNNLALAYVMNGEASKAESMLRSAAAKGGQHADKVQQNLALVLSLQGKYDEAKRIGGASSSTATANEDVALVRQIVKLDPKAAPMVQQGGAVVAGWSAQVVETGATNR